MSPLSADKTPGNQSESVPLKVVIDQVSKSFLTSGNQTIPVLSNISLAARCGEVVVIRGPNGSGKTTLMNLIASLDVPTSGKILINGISPPEYKVGYVFQNYTASLLPWFNIAENITISLRLKGLDRTERHRSLDETLSTTSLGPLPLDRFPFQLSGGQQQKACILRALMTTSQLLILDEPFTSLDRDGKFKLETLIQQLRITGNYLIFLIVHDLDDAIFLGDRILCFDGHPTEMVKEIQVPMPWPREHSIRVHESFLRVRKEVLESVGELKNNV